MRDAVSTLIFQPPPPSKLKEHKIVWLTTREGSKIPSFYIGYRRKNGVESCKSLSANDIRASGPEQGITILYSHANAEDLGSIYPWCKFLSKMLQVNLLAYDYTGYGMAYDEGKHSCCVILCCRTGCDGSAQAVKFNNHISYHWSAFVLTIMSDTCYSCC